MDTQTFSAGVVPGGLRNKRDIKILICFLLGSLKKPLIKSDVICVLQEYGLANYFEASQAFDETVSGGNIVSDDTGYCELTSSGEMIAEELSGDLPFSVKEKVLISAEQYFNRVKNEKENKVSIKKTELGYSVTCTVSGGEFDMMNIMVYAPDMNSACAIRDNFYKNPSDFYHKIMAFLIPENQQ